MYSLFDEVQRVVERLKETFTDSTVKVTWGVSSLAKGQKVGVAVTLAEIEPNTRTLDGSDVPSDATLGIIVYSPQNQMNEDALYKEYMLPAHQVLLARHWDYTKTMAYVMEQGDSFYRHINSQYTNTISG